MCVRADTAWHYVLTAGVERLCFGVFCGQCLCGADLFDTVALDQDRMVFENPIFRFPGDDGCICYEHV